MTSFEEIKRFVYGQDSFLKVDSSVLGNDELTRQRLRRSKDPVVAVIDGAFRKMYFDVRKFILESSKNEDKELHLAIYGFVGDLSNHGVKRHCLWLKIMCLLLKNEFNFVYDADEVNDSTCSENDFVIMSCYDEKLLDYLLTNCKVIFPCPESMDTANIFSELRIIDFFFRGDVETWSPDYKLSLEAFKFYGKIRNVEEGLYNIFGGRIDQYNSCVKQHGDNLLAVGVQGLARIQLDAMQRYKDAIISLEPDPSHPLLSFDRIELTQAKVHVDNWKIISIPFMEQNGNSDNNTEVLAPSRQGVDQRYSGFCSLSYNTSIISSFPKYESGVQYVLAPTQHCYQLPLLIIENPIIPSISVVNKMCLQRDRWYCTGDPTRYVGRVVVPTLSRLLLELLYMVQKNTDLIFNHHWHLVGMSGCGKSTALLIVANHLFVTRDRFRVAYIPNFKCTEKNGFEDTVLLAIKHALGTDGEVQVISRGEKCMEHLNKCLQKRNIFLAIILDQVNELKDPKDNGKGPLSEYTLFKQKFSDSLFSNIVLITSASMNNSYAYDYDACVIDVLNGLNFREAQYLKLEDGCSSEQIPRLISYLGTCPKNNMKGISKTGQRYLRTENERNLSELERLESSIVRQSDNSSCDLSSDREDINDQGRSINREPEDDSDVSRQSDNSSYDLSSDCEDINDQGRSINCEPEDDSDVSSRDGDRPPKLSYIIHEVSEMVKRDVLDFLEDKKYYSVTMRYINGLLQREVFPEVVDFTLIDRRYIRVGFMPRHFVESKVYLNFPGGYPMKRLLAPKGQFQDIVSYEHLMATKEFRDILKASNSCNQLGLVLIPYFSILLPVLDYFYDKYTRELLAPGFNPVPENQAVKGFLLERTIRRDFENFPNPVDAKFQRISISRHEGEYKMEKGVLENWKLQACITLFDPGFLESRRETFRAETFMKRIENIHSNFNKPVLIVTLTNQPDIDFILCNETNAYAIQATVMAGGANSLYKLARAVVGFVSKTHRDIPYVFDDMTVVDGVPLSHKFDFVYLCYKDPFEGRESMKSQSEVVSKWWELRDKVNVWICVIENPPNSTIFKHCNSLYDGSGGFTLATHGIRGTD